MDKAAIALVISGIALLVTVYKLISDERDKRRNVRGTLGTVIAVSEAHEEPALVQIAASIPRGKSAQLSSVAIAPPHGEWLLIYKPHFPFTFPYLLEEGKGASVYVAAEVVAQFLEDRGFSGKVRLRGVFYDATGKKYLSKPFGFDVKGWLSSGTA